MPRWSPHLPSWRTRLLGAIADPNVAFLLLLTGIYGIAIELLHPGFVLPGIVGGIGLLLGLTALTMLPVDYGGLGLLLWASP